MQWDPLKRPSVALIELEPWVTGRKLHPGERLYREQVRRYLKQHPQFDVFVLLVLEIFREISNIRSIHFDILTRLCKCVM